MHGILIVDKPQDFTSFDVVAKLRGICATRRIGHGGTLDPMATGVLPVFVGNAAKAVDMQHRADKRYTATMLLGKRTDTGDVTGTVLEQADVPDCIGQEEVKACLAQFLGDGMQVPPMYSAVKINGQPLYKAARAGKVVERPARPVTIHALELTGHPTQNEYVLDIHCSKGTYVRVLIEEIGRALGVPATMSALRRTSAGPYTLEQAHTLDELQQAKENGTLEQLLVGVESVFMHLPALQVEEDTRFRLLNGAPTYRFPAQDGRYRVSCGGEFLGVCRVSDHTLTVEKLFCERA